MGFDNGQQPRSDHEMLIWVKNFAAGLQPDRPDSVSEADLGFTEDEARRLVELATAYGRALDAASNPLTRTRDSIALKDAARDKAMEVFRLHAGRIKADPRIAPEIKIALGIRLPPTSKPRIAAPTTSPLLNIVGGVPGHHVLTYADSQRPEVKAKPHGVLHLQLYMALTAVNEPQPMDPTQPPFAFVQNVTRTPFKVHFTAEQNGRIATYFGRWATRTGLTGPWSLPVAMTAMGVV